MINLPNASERGATGGESAGGGNPTGQVTPIADIGQEINEMYMNAKDFYNRNMFSRASELFSRVVEILSGKFGEEALELAEPYYFYGDSLFHTSDGDVFGSSINSAINEKAQGIVKGAGVVEPVNIAKQLDLEEDDVPSKPVVPPPHKSVGKEKGVPPKEVPKVNKAVSPSPGESPSPAGKAKKQGDPQVPHSFTELPNLLENSEFDFLGMAESMGLNGIFEVLGVEGLDVGKDVLDGDQGDGDGDGDEDGDGDGEEEEEEEDEDEGDEGDVGGKGGDKKEDMEGSEEGDEESNESVEKEEPIPEEDQPPSEIAWEVLEVARKILSNQSDSKWKLLLADVHTTLGHILLENQNTPEALKEYETALSLRQTFSTTPNHQRGIAEAHYFLAVAYSNVPEEIQKSVNHFNSAQNVLEEYTQQLPSGEEKNALIDTIKDIIIKTEEIVNEANKAPPMTPAQTTQARQTATKSETANVIDLGVLTGGKKIEISKVTTSPDGTPLPQPTLQITNPKPKPNTKAAPVDLGTLQGAGPINLNQLQNQPQPKNKRKRQQESPTTQKDSKKKKTK